MELHLIGLKPDPLCAILIRLSRRGTNGHMPLRPGWGIRDTPIRPSSPINKVQLLLCVKWLYLPGITYSQREGAI